MPVAAKADVVIDKTTLGTTGFVTVTAGDATHTSILLQDLYDAMREWEVELANLDVEALVDGSGKEGLGGGDRRPPTIVVRAHVEINATAGTGPTVRIFTFSGGTLLSDEEAAGAADPRSPLDPVAFVEYDRTKGQEGILLNVDELLDIWTRLFGGRLHVDETTGKERLKTAADVLYSEADIYSDDGVTAYDGTAGVARRDEHIKP